MHLCESFHLLLEEFCESFELLGVGFDGVQL